MKNLIITLGILATFIISNAGLSQQINWRSLNNDKKHFVNINAGWDYATVAGIGYGEKLPFKWPIVANVEYSAAFGENMLDDFKTKLGGQSEVYTINNFSIALKAYGIFRQYKNDYVQMASFGSEFSANIGYYKPKWFVAGEFGFDKAIATHIKNSDIMKDMYPDSEDGWYVPTGGNFFYGLTGGYSFKTVDLYLEIGKAITQDFKTSPTIPYYAEVGVNLKF